MTAQETAFAEIERLVKSFKDIPAAQRKGLNEMQTRLGYILPLFKALGWDTSNTNGSQSVRLVDNLDRVRNLEREIVRVDEEIDQRVYVLYGLTEDEVKVIEVDNHEEK